MGIELVIAFVVVLLIACVIGLSAYCTIDNMKLGSQFWISIAAIDRHDDSEIHSNRFNRSVILNISESALAIPFPINLDPLVKVLMRYLPYRCHYLIYDYGRFLSFNVKVEYSSYSVRSRQTLKIISTPSDPEINWGGLKPDDEIVVGDIIL